MADVFVELSADESKLLNSYRKIRTEQDKVDTGHKKMARSHKQAFGQSAAASITAYAMRLVSVTAGIAAISSAMRSVIAEGERIAQKQRASMEGVGPLAQLAAIKANPEKEFKRLYAESAKSRVAGVGENIGQAAALQFSLTSAGQDQFRSAIATMVATQAVQDPQSLLAAISSVQKAMPKTAGTFQQVISRGLGAAGGMPATIEQTLQAVAKVGPAAQELGFTQNDIYGASAVTAGVMGDPEKAGTYLRQFFTSVDQLTKDGTLKPGKSLASYVEDIQKMEAKGISVYKSLGEVRSIEAYRALRNNPELFAQSVRQTREGLQNNAYQNMIRLSETMPELAIPVTRKKSEGNKEIAEERAGQIADLEASIIADELARGRRKGASSFDIQITKFFQQAALYGSKVFGDTAFIEKFKESGSPETQQAIDNFLRASELQLEAAETMNNASMMRSSQAAQRVAE